MNVSWSPARARIPALLAFAVLTATGCTSNNVTTGIVDGRLAPCPKSPNPEIA